MPLTPSITPSPSLQQAQTANMEAQKANLTNGNTQISGGTAVGSTGTYNPGQVQTNQVPTIAPPAQVQTSGAVSATPKLPTQEATPTPVLPNTQSTTTSQPTTSATQDQNWIGNVKPATLPTTKPATPSTPATPTAPTVPQTAMPDIYGKASTEQKQSADSLLNIVDPTGNLSPAAQADIKNAFLSGDTANMQRIADVYGMDATQTANFINAYRTTRDANLSENRTTSQASLANDRAVQEYDTAIAQQQAKVKATANNMSVMQDTAGRLQSQNMADAIVGEMQMQQRILANLQQSKNWALAEIASNAKYQHDVLANNYNDAMSQYDSQLQEQIKNLSDTGLAGTAKGLSMLQSNIEKTNLAKYQLGQQYAKSLQSATDIMKMQVDKKTLNIDATNQINDGYLHNAQGEVVVGPSGKPLVSNPQKKLSSTTTDNQGNIIGIYSDGTHAVISEGQPATVQDIHNYAKAVQAGGASILEMLPPNIQQQVMLYMGQSGMGPTEKPTIQEITNPDGTKTTVQYNKETNSWTPITVNTSYDSNSATGLLDYISDSEGTHGNYNAMYGKGGQQDINLTGMTIGQIQDLQRKNIYQDKNGNYVGGAMGKYQIVSGTLQGLINRGVVSKNDMFDQETQDKMAMSLIGNAYDSYKSGKITADQLQNKVSGIWAGVPNTKGKSTYASDGTNKASADNGAFLQAVGQPGGQSTGYSADQASILKNMGNVGDLTKEDKATLKKYGLSEADVASYKGDLNNLSTSAKQAKDTKYITGTPTQVKQTANELYEAGVLNNETGNEKYYTMKSVDKQQLLDTVKAKQALDKVKAIWDKHVEAGDANEFLGGYDQAFIKGKMATGINTDFVKDYVAMDNALGKELSQYMNKISGATVGDKEVDRLKKQIPNMAMNEAEFQNAMNDYSTTLGSTQDFILKEYGFKDVPTLMGEMTGNVPQPGTAPSQDRVDNIKNILTKK